VRSGVPSRFDTAALPELQVAALSEDDSQRLLDLHHPRLDPKIRRIVLELLSGSLRGGQP
jgi:hypothetical protein